MYKAKFANTYGGLSRETPGGGGGEMSILASWVLFVLSNKKKRLFEICDK